MPDEDLDQAKMSQKRTRKQEKETLNKLVLNLNLKWEGGLDTNLLSFSCIGFPLLASFFVVG